MTNFRISFKYFFFCLIGVSLSIIATLLLLEVVLRFFPVNEGLRAQAVNDQSPIFKFEPNRESLYSKNWNFDISNKVIVNNAGFVNNNDYNDTLQSPLISIIGDSYVEALMVPFEKTISGLLSKEKKSHRVYSFAASGAGLSQHLVWANFSKNKYKSDYFIFVVISNDFSESLNKYGSSPGFHRFDIKNKDTWNLLLTNYEPSTLRKVFRNSKLAMYLITNLKIHTIFNIPLNLGKSDKRQKYVSNFDAEVSEEFWLDSTLATDIYLKNITKFTGVNKDKILFVIDGIRPEVYDKNSLHLVKNSFWAKMRNYFIKEAKIQGFETIDMQEFFLKQYAIDNKKFEFKTDSHWNKHGHANVYKAISESILWQNFLK